MTDRVKFDPIGKKIVPQASMAVFLWATDQEAKYKAKWYDDADARALYGRVVQNPRIDVGRLHAILDRLFALNLTIGLKHVTPTGMTRWEVTTLEGEPAGRSYVRPLPKLLDYIEEKFSDLLLVALRAEQLFDY